MSDDDEPCLSVDTFRALQEFYKEREEEERQLQYDTSTNANLESIPFQEDWQLSQFWYDDATVESLSTEVARVAGSGGKVALISCPSLYKTVKEKALNCEVALFEFDKRFSIYGEDFHFYDYKSPLAIPRNLAGEYDVVVADPPFLSDECLTKTAVTIKFLARSKIILCTGAIMEDLASRLLELKKCNFSPGHRNNLANEFYCYSNYNMDEFLK